MEWCGGIIFHYHCRNVISLFYLFFHPFTEHECSTWPTLLHFGARFNLTKFCDTLLSSPLFRELTTRKNKQGQLPHDIAREHGHVELAAKLESCYQHVGTCKSFVGILVSGIELLVVEISQNLESKIFTSSKVMSQLPDSSLVLAVKFTPNVLSIGDFYFKRVTSHYFNLTCRIASSLF